MHRVLKENPKNLVTYFRRRKLFSKFSETLQGTWNLMDRIKWGQNKLIRPEDAWRSYLENPLATAGLMSLQNHGDETTHTHIHTQR